MDSGSTWTLELMIRFVLGFVYMKENQVKIELHMHIFIQLWIIIGNTQNRSRKRRGGKRKRESLKCRRKSETQGDIKDRNRKIYERSYCGAYRLRYPLKKKGFLQRFSIIFQEL